MKKTISTHEELLISLASKGDASAFFSLTAPYLKKAYLALRSEFSHSEATEKLLPLASELFSSIRNVYPKSFDEWIGGQKSFDEIVSNDHDIQFDINLNSESALFLNEVQRHLLKLSAVKKKQKFIRLSQHVKTLLYSGTGVLALTVVYLVLYFSKVSLCFTCTTPAKEFNLTIPFRNNTKPADSVSVADSTAQVSQDTVTTDSVSAIAEDSETVKQAPRIVNRPAPPVPRPKPVAPVTEVVQEQPRTHVPAPAPPPVPVPKPVPKPAPPPDEPASTNSSEPAQVAPSENNPITGME